MKAEEDGARIELLLDAIEKAAAQSGNFGAARLDLQLDERTAQEAHGLTRPFTTLDQRGRFG